MNIENSIETRTCNKTINEMASFPTMIRAKYIEFEELELFKEIKDTIRKIKKDLSYSIVAIKKIH